MSAADCGITNKNIVEYEIGECKIKIETLVYPLYMVRIMERYEKIFHGGVNIEKSREEIAELIFKNTNIPNEKRGEILESILEKIKTQLIDKGDWG